MLHGGLSALDTAGIRETLRSRVVFIGSARQELVVEVWAALDLRSPDPSAFALIAERGCDVRRDRD